MSDFLEEDIAPLRHFTWVMGHRDSLQGGAHVEVPSPAIPARTDHVVVLFSRSTSSSAAGLIVRNRGKYSNTKSAALAERLSALLGEMELSTADRSCTYEEGRPYYQGSGDTAGTWVFLEEHRTAPRLLGEAEAELAAKEAKRPALEPAKPAKCRKGKKGKKGPKSC